MPYWPIEYKKTDVEGEIIKPGDLLKSVVENSEEEYFYAEYDEVTDSICLRGIKSNNTNLCQVGVEGTVKIIKRKAFPEKM